LYNIQSIPLLLFFKKGKIINKIVGLPAKNELYAAIEKAIK
jgi:thioredoxin-like negative regulator of GroEL